MSCGVLWCDDVWPSVMECGVARCGALTMKTVSKIRKAQFLGKFTNV